MAMRGHSKTETCAVCGVAKSARHVIPGHAIRTNIAEYIEHSIPGWTPEKPVCVDCLNRLRTDYVRSQMEKERGELTDLEQEVIRSLRQNESVVENLNKEFDDHLTFGERLADRVAEIGGSWGFVTGFAVFLVVWVIINTAVLLSRAFDPYPFILLNLFLSMLAAIQAPIIMMSQNRAAARDRLQAEQDFKTNLKAELEVRAVSDKLDQLLHNQWVRLLEIQQIQMEMLEDLTGRKER